MRVRKVETSGTKGVGRGICGDGLFKAWRDRHWKHVGAVVRREEGSWRSVKGRLSAIVVVVFLIGDEKGRSDGWWSLLPLRRRAGMA